MNLDFSAINYKINNNTDRTLMPSFYGEGEFGLQ